jgi:hypothetical protein
MKRFLLLLCFAQSAMAADCIIISDDVSAKFAAYQQTIAQAVVGKAACYYNTYPDGTLGQRHITYLGSVKTQKHGTVAILNDAVTIHYSGDMARGRGEIIAYNGKTWFSAHVGGLDDLPDRLEGTQLVFDKQAGDCNQRTDINLQAGLPQRFFVRCENDMGDVYGFFPRKLR